MSGRAYTRPTLPSDRFREHTDFLRWEIAPEERVGPLPRARRRWPRWMMVLTLALAGGGWAMVDDKPAALEWLSSSTASAIALGRSMIGETDREPAPEASPPLQLAALSLLDGGLIRAALVGQTPPREIVPEKIAAVAEPDAKAAASEKSSEAEAVAEPEKPAPLPPLPPLTDPLQKKAEAVGLHPELSRAVLQSLTATDFKNAAVAIRKAIAETPEDGVLLWPPKPGRGLARFRVHFVPGISPACRRYVVGVAKSGWLTTALPMERCGVKPRVARSQRVSKESRGETRHP